MKELGKESVGTLRKTVRDERSYGVGRVGELVAQLSVGLKAGALQDRRNCIGGIECFLIDLQFFDAFGAHAEGVWQNACQADD